MLAQEKVSDAQFWLELHVLKSHEILEWQWFIFPQYGTNYNNTTKAMIHNT